MNKDKCVHTIVSTMVDYSDNNKEDDCNNDDDEDER